VFDRKTKLIYNVYTFQPEDMKIRDHWRDLGLHGTIILKTILNKCGGRTWLGFNWLSSTQLRLLVNMKVN
jgi:hypothetical protein